jgi:conjugal transfer pilus assembly protein TraE
MDFKVQQHRLGQLATRLNLMVALVFGLLFTNLLMGSLAWYTAVHQKVEITPFSGVSEYRKSDVAVDGHYLSMMSENFIYSRLNVTPETVRTSHKRLLSFVNAKHYPKFLEQLNKEARVVTSKKISSYIEIKSITVDEKHLSCTVKGNLRRSVGARALHEEHVTYTLHYAYHLGRLTVIQFTHAEDESHA